MFGHLLGRQASVTFAPREGGDIFDTGAPPHRHPVVFENAQRKLPVGLIDPECYEGGSVPEVHRRPSCRSSERSSSRASAPGRKGWPSTSRGLGTAAHHDAPVLHTSFASLSTHPPPLRLPRRLLPGRFARRAWHYRHSTTAPSLRISSLESSDFSARKHGHVSHINLAGQACFNDDRGSRRPCPPSPRAGAAGARWCPMTDGNAGLESRTDDDRLPGPGRQRRIESATGRSDSGVA